MFNPIYPPLFLLGAHGLLRLAIILSLQGKLDAHVTFWGICCSSWVAINRGTSCRDYLNPHGHPTHFSVALANLLVSRLGYKGVTVCNLMLVTNVFYKEIEATFILYTIVISRTLTLSGQFSFCLSPSRWGAT